MVLRTGNGVRKANCKIVSYIAGYGIYVDTGHFEEKPKSKQHTFLLGWHSILVRNESTHLCIDCEEHAKSCGREMAFAV